MKRAVIAVTSLALMFGASFAVPVGVLADVPHYCEPTAEFDEIMFAAWDGDTVGSNPAAFEIECQYRGGYGPWPDMDDWHWGNSAGAFQGSDNDKAESIAIRGRSGEKYCVTVFEHAGPPPLGGEDWTYSVIGATSKAINLPASIDNRVSAYEMWRAQSTTSACLPHTYTYVND